MADCGNPHLVVVLPNLVAVVIYLGYGESAWRREWRVRGGGVEERVEGTWSEGAGKGGGYGESGWRREWRVEEGVWRVEGE